jgi:hypothetical protein
LRLYVKARDKGQAVGFAVEWLSTSPALDDLPSILVPKDEVFRADWARESARRMFVDPMSHLQVGERFSEEELQQWESAVCIERDVVRGRRRDVRLGVIAAEEVI